MAIMSPEMMGAQVMKKMPTGKTIAATHPGAGAANPMSKTARPIPTGRMAEQFAHGQSSKSTEKEKAMNGLKTFNILPTIALVLVALFAVFPLSAQQTVDPSGSCTMDSKVDILAAQTGFFTCVPATAGATTGTWQKIAVNTPVGTTVGYTINYTNATLAAATTSADVSLPALPAGATIVGVKIALLVKPLAPSLSALTVSVGDSVSATAYSSAYDTFITVSNTTVSSTGSVFKITGKTAVTPLVHFVPTGANLSALTAGQWQISITYVLAPASFTTVTAGLQWHSPVSGMPERRLQLQV